MSESPYVAMREYIRVAVELEVKKATTDLRDSLTRSVPVQGPPGLPGKDGSDGKDGRDGIDGKPGTDGKDGKPGERGTDGIIGRDGKDGLNGTDGKSGEKGERGADGIATREEVTSLIEDRFADVQVRSLADTWRGVWKAGETYKRGEVAQWDGSPWLALRDSKDVKPGTSGPDWNLFAKKGRDGR